MKQGLSLLLSLSCLTLSQGIFLTSATAQVTPDGTTNTTVNVNGNDFTINQGDRAGSNLFHSFGEFSVPTEGSAFFNNAADIVNIFSRVTGGNISNINGLLGANGSANLFLLNPAGIIFGSSARLDIGGSFFSTTADSFLFEDGEFSATDLDNPPLITINAPIGLNFRENPGEIVNRSVGQNPNGETNVIGGPVGLQVPDGETLALVGGNIVLESGNLTAAGGRIELGSVVGNGLVSLNQASQGFVLGYEGLQNFGDIQINQGALIDVSAEGGGKVQIQGARLVTGNLSGIFAITLGKKNGGDVLIQATDEIVLDNAAMIAGVSQQATGSGGNITVKTRQLNINGELGVISTSTLGEGDAVNLTVETERLVIRDGGQLTAATRGAGNAGKLTVGASESVEVSGTTTDGSFRSGLLAETNSTASNAGDGGELTITTGQLLVQDGASVGVETLGAGDAGNLKIDTRQLSILNGGQVSAGTRGTPSTGQGGSITVNASEFVEVIGTRGEAPSGLFAPTFGAADGGDLTITTRSLSVREGGTISTSTAAAFGESRGGDLTINASESVEVIGTSEASGEDRLFSSIVAETGRLLEVVPRITEPASGGNLTINTSRLTISDGARVSTSTFGMAGKAGNLNVNASESVDLVGMDGDGNISTLTTTTEGTGDSGGVRIKTERLFLRDGAQISAATSADGNSGNINITNDFLTVTNQAEVKVSSTARGSGGNLEIKANSIELNRGTLEAETTLGEGGNVTLKIDDTLIMGNNSLISAQAFEDANGGNIDVDADFIIAFPSQPPGDGNDILASAERGMGGNIDITVGESLFGIEERDASPGNGTNDIDVSSEFSFDGTVNINSSDINPIQGVAELPQNIVVPEQTTAQACRTNRELAAQSGFTISGKGGIPPSPELPLSSQNIVINGEISSSRSTIPQPIQTSQGEIQPARGIKVTESGGIILTAYRTNNAGERIPEGLRNCDPV